MIYPIILCGGTGTRLWPSSRQTFPKQFAPVFGDISPFQALLGLFSGIGFNAPVITTRTEFRFMAEDQARETGVWDARFLLEPEGRGTAASVLTAALTIEDDPDAVILIAPVVHFAGEPETFRSAIRDAEARVRKGAVVRFFDRVSEPTANRAKIVEELVAEGDSRGAGVLTRTGHGTEAEGQAIGMTMLRRADLLAAFDALAPELLKPCRKAVDQAKVDQGIVSFARGDYQRIPEAGFEEDIVSGMKGALAMPVGGACSTLEDWESVWRVMDRDENGVCQDGGALAVDCRDSLLRCDEQGMQILGVGLTNVVAVAMRDAVLVADRDHLAKIPGALDKLAARKTPHAREYPRYHRPWGWYESLIARDRFQVKRIMVKPGGVLSLQSHVHRSEHWIVVGGTARVTIDDEVKLVPENGSVYIPLGATHRMANPGKVPMYLIEVQTGTYLGEDDIVRYEDIYDRC
jgi:mannose-1-phosphate guanylyltransferase/mannose-6-phosphate isomerase